MLELWTEKYQPRKLRELAGQTQATKAMLEWAKSWARGKPKKSALLLYGATGTGKTAAVSALAHEFGWDLIELNASDKRTLRVIQKVAGTAATTGTLLGGTGSKRLIVLDEADNVYGAVDRGGYRAIAELLEQTQNPVVLIANDQYKIPWKIRRACLALNFRRLTTEAITDVLERICRAERVDAEPQALKTIGDAANGDLRSAINDLQTIAAGRKRLTLEDVMPHQRDRSVSIFDALKQLTYATNGREARELLWRFDRPPDDALTWIDENIPRMLTDPADLVRAYDAISRADIFLTRAKHRGAYGMWGYASDMMSAGVALSRKGKLKFVRFQSPSHVIRFARTRALRGTRDSIARKIALSCHVSSKEARKHYMPYLGFVLKHRRDTQIAEELELEDAEKDYLVKLV